MLGQLFYVCNAEACGLQRSYFAGTGFFQEVRGCVWAGELKTTLQAAYREFESAKKEGRFGFSEEKIRALESPFSEIVEKGLQKSPPPKREPGQKGRARNNQERNLLLRLQKHKEAALRFYLDYVDWETPFDNRQAESDLRMLKVLLKAAGCFRTVKGAARSLTIRSFWNTRQKHSLHLMNSPLQAIRGTFNCNFA